MENRTTTKALFQMQMTAIRTSAPHTERFVTDDRADRELIAFTQKQMREKLAAARTKGRTGWWNKSECSIEQLENLLQEAVAKKDMINIINYAAMINARRIADD